MNDLYVAKHVTTEEIRKQIIIIYIISYIITIEANIINDDSCTRPIPLLSNETFLLVVLGHQYLRLDD